MPVPAIRIMQQGSRGSQLDAAYLIQLKGVYLFLLAQGIDVHLVANLLDDRLGFPRGVPKDIFPSSSQGLFGKPAYHGINILADCRLVVGLGDHVAPRKVNLVLQGEAHRLRGKRFLLLTIR